MCGLTYSTRKCSALLLAQPHINLNPILILEPRTSSNLALALALFLTLIVNATVTLILALKPNPSP